MSKRSELRGSGVALFKGGLDVECAQRLSLMGDLRAAIEHNLLYERPLRIWTGGPMFRHERPQKGRYRQFHQLDVEALGFAREVPLDRLAVLAGAHAASAPAMEVAGCHCASSASKRSSAARRL